MRAKKLFNFYNEQGAYLGAYKSTSAKGARRLFNREWHAVGKISVVCQDE